MKEMSRRNPVLTVELDLISLKRSELHLRAIW